jgi:hypothetical protein
MANLSELQHERCFLIALPWRVQGLDSSPVRVIAVEGETDDDNKVALEQLSNVFSLKKD